MNVMLSRGFIMSVVILRGFSPVVEKKVRRYAAHEKKSINRFLLDLIEEKIVGKSYGKPREFNDLDDLIGTMDKADAREIEKSVSRQDSFLNSKDTTMSSKVKASKGLKKGYVQVYTGNGKGKSSAAFGMALRAAGAGLRVYLGQFIKKGNFSEIKALSHFADLIKIRQFGKGCFVGATPSKYDCDLAKKGLKEAESEMHSGNYDLVILDEANCATWKKLFPAKELLRVISEKPGNVEMIITGRNADPLIMECADLVTEMREIRHYAEKGVPARKGIEF